MQAMAENVPSTNGSVSARIGADEHGVGGDPVLLAPDEIEIEIDADDARRLSALSEVVRVGP